MRKTRIYHWFLRAVFLICLILLSLCSAPISNASVKNFDVSVSSGYVVDKEGATEVTENITLTNNTDYIFAPSYSIYLGFTTIRNIQVYNEDGGVPYEVKKENEKTKITVLFTKRVVGLGEKNSFTFSFETPEIAKKKGNIWEVYIPGIESPDDFSAYSVTLKVPESFGKASIIKTKNSESFSSQLPYRFSKEHIGTSGVSLYFGTEQFYKLNLSYHLSNKNLFPIKTEVALPPSTNYQTAIIKKLSHVPSTVYPDRDGNWLAVYSLDPQEKRTVTAEVYIQVKLPTQTVPLNQEDRNVYLQSAEYWEVGNKEVKALAQSLSTVESVYAYVTRKLSYNYDKVSDENIRLGAAKALENPTYSVCLEFTDLFIALARAKGIPARSVEGYAYTENSKLKPLSLVKDVLHAWPEYYDYTKKTWVMVDPTWGNTTRGADYFKTFDFDHITFVKNGEKSAYPVPAGGYKLDRDSKDVDLDFLDPKLFQPGQKYEIATTLPHFAVSGLPISGKVIVRNKGNSAISGSALSIQSEFDSGSKEIYIDSVPPFGEKSVDVSLGTTQFLTNKKYRVAILFENNVFEKFIIVSIFPLAGWISIGGGICAGACILFIIARKTRGLFVPRQK